MTRGATAAALGLLLIFAGCRGERRPPPPGTLTVSVEQHASWVRNFNPLVPTGAARWPTLAGIYEPLLVFNSIHSRYEPWLATGYTWSEDLRTLRFAVRPGVVWSDGKPFTARDVAFTFQTLRRHPALDRSGVWGFLEDVRAEGEDTVAFLFKRVYLPGLDDVAGQPLVPEHIWREVENPVTFTNPDPVATGPFTEVLTFEHQLFELGRNPRYWQPGKPYVERLRFPAYPSNERANLALAFAEVDWSANFVPAIERVYVSRDPEHNRYWFPLTGSTIFLYANTLTPPLDDVRVRKALSLAIDRALMVDVALYGYTRPSDATGLSDAYSGWRSAEAIAAGDWVRHDVEAAKRLLDEAGLLAGPDGLRRRADGTPLRLEVLSVAGWSDWVRAAQVIARGLRTAGVDARVRTYDFGAWFERLQSGQFELSLGWSQEGPTPYIFYRSLMAKSTARPLGEPAPENWGRFVSPTADTLLQRFEVEPDPAKQRALSDALQLEFVTAAPAIPLYPNPSWAEFRTERFVGFPSAQDPYADASPNKFGRGECLLVLTNVRPR